MCIYVQIEKRTDNVDVCVCVSVRARHVHVSLHVLQAGGR